MTAVRFFVSDCDGSRVEVEASADEVGLPMVNVCVAPLGGTGVREQCIELTMDEARQVVAGLAAVIR